jgi:dynein heavy chain, axonemal
MLVSTGGSGRKSLARLATFVADQKCFSIEISKNYRIMEFREDLKELYKLAGCQNKPTTFLFDETQIKYETFVEDINNILTSGEVPNLFPKDEIGPVVDEVSPYISRFTRWQLPNLHTNTLLMSRFLWNPSADREIMQVRADAKKAGVSETQEALYRFFLERVRTNLHVVLCLSPIGDGFRTRCRMFPGLVNCTTIDWFTPWPADALFEVASKLLESADVAADTRKAVCQVFTIVPIHLHC